MEIQTYDFQPVIHQQVTQLVEQWRGFGFEEDDVQESAGQCFNMGLIAAQQVQQEGGIQPQGTSQTIPYTISMAERVVELFLQGLNQAVLKAAEMRLPSAEKWQFMQNVAFHVFEQSKQAVIATFGQEDTPEVQIPQDQIIAWVGNTAVEALIYYINEHEKQHGPLVRMGEQTMPDLLSESYEDPTSDAAMPELAAVPEPEPEPEPVYEEPVYEQEPEPEPVMTAPEPEYAPEPQAIPPAPMPDIPEVHYKFAAISLMLNTMPERRQRKMMNTFNAEEQDIITQYRNPDMITSRMDLGKVAAYLKRFKEQLGQPGRKPKSSYGDSVSKLISSLPSKRLEKIFQNERPGVRGYVRQFLNPSSDAGEPFALPPGVEEGLARYIERNFPTELEAARR